MATSPAKKKAKTSSSPPDMSALHAPTAKGWGKTEWAQWRSGLKAQLDNLPDDDERMDKFMALCDARNEAVLWAAPEGITVKISIFEEIACENNEDVTVEATRSTAEAPVSSSAAVSTSQGCTKPHEIVISKHGNDTFRSVLDSYCKEKNIERDNYDWRHMDKPVTHVSSLLNQTDVKCFFQLWHCHPPTLVSRFANENTFLPEIVGKRKSSPKLKPSMAPSFEKLKSAPPDGNASSEDWDKWHDNNCGGTVDFWMDKNKAVEYRCPDYIDIILKGLSHEHTVRVTADEPLSIALSSYCASTNGTDFAVTPSEGHRFLLLYFQITLEIE